MSKISVARKRSDDPLQEHLRQRKQVWNEACSAFIARLNAFKPRLIAFKQGLNGKGNAKAGLPPSDIKAPLPSEINGYMGVVNSTFNELASEFSALVSESNGIVQEQAQYAEHRHKPQLRQPGRRAETLQIDDSLVVEGSNKITRLWAQLSSILSSDETKRQRLSMLGLGDKLFKNLVKFEDLILSSNINEMEKVLNGYFLIVNNLDALKHSLHKLLKITNKTSPLGNPNSLPIQEQPKSKSPAEPTSVKEAPRPPAFHSPAGIKIDDMNMHQLKNEVASMMQLGFTVNDVRIFLDIYHKNKNEKDPNKINLITDRLRDIYYQLFNLLKAKIEKEIGHKLPKDITLEDIRELKSNAFLENTEITKLAGNFVSRYFNSLKHKRSKDPSSASRIEIYDTVREMKIVIDNIMDLLENKNLDTNALVTKIADAEKLMIQIGEPLNHLNILYKDKYFEPGSDKRKHNILDPAGRYFNRQIQHDIDKPNR